MSLYIDEEYESNTLTDLLVEAQKIARETWYREIESRVIYRYRDLARADVKAGRSTPVDYPSFSPAVFVDSPFDTVDPRLVELWEQRLLQEITTPVNAFRK